MKFLFRAPLLDFDPQDEKEIVENWDRILKIISVSSTSLFDEISQKTYSSLHPKLKKKVYKYILRGRYRSTPFGLLAAVGLGEFNDIRNYRLDMLNVNPIPQSPGKFKSVNADKSCFYLAEGGYEKLGNLHFLSYQSQNERWGLASIPKNKSINFIINQLKGTKSIDFALFKELFEDPTVVPAEEIWNMMIDLGIVNSVESATWSKPNVKPKTDMVFKDEISLPTHMLAEIREFYLQAGGLFCKAENLFLKSFKEWFTDKFDDRFVPLTLLVQYDEFINKVFLKRQDRVKEWGALPDFNIDLSTLKSLDLKPLFPQKRLDSGIFDMQLAFKTGEEATSILLENVVCNRPFVYYGRFNRDKKLYCQQKKTKDTIYQSKEVHYAELKLIESRNVESICDTKQVFEKLMVDTYDAPNKKSILGPKILAKAVVVLDLVKDDFYIKPYDNSVLDYSFRLDFQFHNSEVVEVADSSKAYQAGVRLGHVLKTANNIKLDSLSKCDQLKIDWQEFYLQKNIEFVFQSDSGEVIYNYEAPDIIAQQ